MINIYNKHIPYFDDKIEQPEPSIDPYLVSSNEPSPAILIVPGGAYARKAPHEGEPIASWLNTLGISAFVLDYRVFPYTYPAPILDAKRAIRYIRFYSKELNIDPNRVGILGFSAGGHLASTVCVDFDDETSESIFDEVDKVSCRPDMSILCYPVISLSKYTHEGSVNNLLGETQTKELKDSLSSHLQVKDDTPPTFIWHTAPDKSVPFQNSLLYAEALQEKSIPFELHIFPEGGHGLGLKDDFPYVKRWADLCSDWLKEMKFI